jgi:CheY-like chemotaxis protein
MSLTVLIVDDEENARLNIASFLTGNGYVVLHAATLGEAREPMRISSCLMFAFQMGMDQSCSRKLCTSHTDRR